MGKLHVLWDFENVQPTLEQLAKLTPGFTDLWLFHGPHQAKQAQQLKEIDSRITLVPRSGAGPNALDFHLSFYLGYVAAKNPDSLLVVVANDKGYDPMLAHARLLMFKAKRVGFKTKSVTDAKRVNQPKELSPQTPPDQTLFEVRLKNPTPVAAKKKATATKTIAAKKVAQKAAVKSIKKIVALKTPAAKKTIVIKAPVTVDVQFNRVKKGLVKMNDKAPAQTDILTASYPLAVGQRQYGRGHRWGGTKAGKSEGGEHLW